MSRLYWGANCMILSLLASLLAAALTHAGIAGPPEEPEQLLESWLDRRLKDSLIHTDRGGGLMVRWSWTLSARMSREEVEERWAAIEKYVDHPERDSLEYARQLLREPEHVEGTLWFAGSSLWHSRETRGAAARTHLAGGTGNTRWMLWKDGSGHDAARGHLTIIKAGVPFPVHRNVGRTYDVSAERMALFQLDGLPWIKRQWTIDSVSSVGSAWTALYDTGVRQQLRVQGKWDSVARPVIQSMDYVGGGESARLRFFDYAFNESLDILLPGRVVFDRLDSIRETYVIHEIRPVTEEEVRNRARIPEVKDSVTISDFRDPDSPELADYPNSRLAVWTRLTGGDAYEPLERRDAEGGPNFPAADPQVQPASWRVTVLWGASIALTAGIVVLLKVLASKNKSMVPLLRR